MTKKELSQYYWTRHEITQQKARLERLEKKMHEETQTVIDGGTRYVNGKKKVCRIEGIAETDIKVPAMVIALKQEIEKNIRKSERLAAEIEVYIQSVEEPRLREVMRSRFLDCLSWEEVGMRNFLAPDYARRIVREYLNQNKTD